MFRRSKKDEFNKVALSIGITTLTVLGLHALPVNPVLGGVLLGLAVAGVWAYGEQQKEDMRRVAREEYAFFNWNDR